MAELSSGGRSGGKVAFSLRQTIFSKDLFGVWSAHRVGGNRTIQAQLALTRCGVHHILDVFTG